MRERHRDDADRLVSAEYFERFLINKGPMWISLQ